MAGAYSGAARARAGAFAGSSRGGAAWTAEGRIDEGDAVSVERREPVRRGRRGGGSGAGDLVVETAALGVEDSRDDGNSAQRVSVDCGAAELRRDFLPGGSSFPSGVTRSRRHFSERAGRQWRFISRTC